MFVTVYFPIFDMRNFLHSRDTQTQRPLWPVPNLSKTPFQRNLGAIINRPWGGIRGWVAEDQICEIRRSIHQLPGAARSEGRLVRLAFKRFYSDGKGGAQFSVGASVPAAQCTTHDEVKAALSAILEAKLKSRHRDGEVAIESVGNVVADLFSTGTTKGNQPSGPDAYVYHGRPLIMIEGLRSVSTGPGNNGLPGRQAASVQDLSHAYGSALPGPVLAIDPSAGDRYSRRAMRMIIARLYLELFCFERCVALLTSPQLSDLDQKGHELLRERTAVAAARLTGKAAPAIARQVDIYEQLADAFATVHQPGRIDALQMALQTVGASPNAKAAVMAAATQTGVIDALSIGNFEGAITVNNYTNNGQAGAMGENAQASNFNQAFAAQAANIDLPALAAELAKLQQALKDEASDMTAEQLENMTAIAKAKDAADAGNGSGALEQLAKAGKWALSVAEKIGVAVAAAVIKQQAGL